MVQNLSKDTIDSIRKLVNLSNSLGDFSIKLSFNKEEDFTALEFILEDKERKGYDNVYNSNVTPIGIRLDNHTKDKRINVFNKELSCLFINEQLSDVRKINKLSCSNGVLNVRNIIFNVFHDSDNITNFIVQSCYSLNGSQNKLIDLLLKHKKDKIDLTVKACFDFKRNKFIKYEEFFDNILASIKTQDYQSSIADVMNAIFD